MNGCCQSLARTHSNFSSGYILLCIQSSSRPENLACIHIYLSRPQPASCAIHNTVHGLIDYVDIVWFSDQPGYLNACLWLAPSHNPVVVFVTGAECAAAAAARQHIDLSTGGLSAYMPGTHMYDIKVIMIKRLPVAYMDTADILGAYLISVIAPRNQPSSLPLLWLQCSASVQEFTCVSAA